MNEDLININDENNLQNDNQNNELDREKSFLEASNKIISDNDNDKKVDKKSKEKKTMENCSKNKRGLALPAFLIAIAIIVSSIGGMYLFVNYKKGVGSSISATGSAEINLTSDLVVWRGTFTAFATTSKEAYNVIKVDAEKVKQYMANNGILESEVVYDSVGIYEKTEPIYDQSGNWRGSKFVGYELSQNVTITSTDIDKVEKISRDISSLLEQGVQFTSHYPEYYCTTLSDKKLELIKLATENAKERIDIMANGAGAKIGKLKNSKLGVFQIVAKNSGTSSYAYDGYLDTASREKTATITIKLEYAIQ